MDFPVFQCSICAYLLQPAAGPCSDLGGIRSTIALFITGTLAGYLFLRTPWRRAVLAAAVFPITILKNGLRISVLSTLGAYVDERILSSPLHHKGGIVFFILALVLM